MLPLEDRVAERLTPIPRASGTGPHAAAATVPWDRSAQRLFGHQHQEQVSSGDARRLTFPQPAARASSSRRAAFPGGWSIYAKEGRPKYCYKFYGVDLFHVESTERVPEGTHRVRMEFRYDGGGPAKGGNRDAFIDD